MDGLTGQSETSVIFLPARHTISLFIIHFSDFTDTYRNDSFFAAEMNKPERANPFNLPGYGHSLLPL